MEGSNHYEFKLDGRRRRGSPGTANKQAGHQRGTPPSGIDYKNLSAAKFMCSSM